MQLLNVRTKELEDAKAYVDDNNEIVAEFSDGGILKFPAGLSKEELEAAVIRHNETEDNLNQEIVTPEMEAERVAEKANSENVLNEVFGGTPEEDKTDDPQPEEEKPTE